MREQIEKITCDSCGKECNEDATTAGFSIPIERYTDSAGSGDTRSIDFDLCLKCKTFVLRKLFEAEAWKSTTVGFIKTLVKNAKIMD